MNSIRPSLVMAGLTVAAVCGASSPPEPELPYLVIDGKVDRITYTGWQVFQENCSRCHGIDASGTPVAPDLTERINHLSQDQFRVLVLSRYFITVPLEDAVREGSGETLQAMEESRAAHAEKRQSPVDMPRWESNPDVRDHIRELYAYLAARADGVLGKGVPELLPE
jgi:hypothetical protein